MEISEASRQAVAVRELYRELEQRRHGREWSLDDLMIGFTGDVGDLGKLLTAYQGRRSGPEDIRGALEHELADCLWSVLVLAHALDVDLDVAFGPMMDALAERVRAKLDETV